MNYRTVDREPAYQEYRYDIFLKKDVAMLKNLLVVSGLVLFFAACTIGCSKPGAVVHGSASGDNFANSGEVDDDGVEDPKGLARQN